MAALPQVVERLDYSGQKLFSKDFDGQSLVRANFRGSTLLNCKFNKCDLSFANFEGANCQGSDFTGARLYKARFIDTCLVNTIMSPQSVDGMDITLNWSSYRGMRLAKLWWFILLYGIVAVLKGPPDTDEIASGIQEVIGQTKMEELQTLMR